MNARRLASRSYHLARERLMGLAERRHGIETAQRVGLHEAGLAAPGRVGYEPSPVLALRRGLRGREIRPDDVFLDLGCGKGRVLVEAVQLPFARVIGVELVPGLVEQARANLARVQHKCASAEVVRADVLEYDIPDDVTVVYLYNPFQGEIFRGAMERIVASLDRAPRQLTLIYRSPFEHEQVLATGRFALAREYRGIVPGSVGSALRVYESPACADTRATRSRGRGAEVSSYRLYVIPGSHACRSAMLMLEHKRLPYRRVDLVTLTHPFVARARGFGASGEKRVAGGRRPRPLRGGDRLGTVPALAADGRRVSTNRRIARFLDEEQSEPSLFPADARQRRAVEEAERWANDTLQMAARRIALAWAAREPSAMSRATADGRMGHLLYRRPLTRRLVIPLIGRLAFAVEPAGPDPLADLPALLDRIDAWIADGVLGGEQLNAADFMVAPSLALVLYRPDALPLFEGRPALDLVDRILPEPA